MSGELSAEPSLARLGTSGLVADAFEEAWGRVAASGSPYASEPYVAKAKDALLKRILSTHHGGERSKAKLVEEGLAFIASLRLRRG